MARGKKVNRNKKDPIIEKSPEAPKRVTPYVGCPVPAPINCCKGVPVKGDDDHVTLVCTNAECSLLGKSKVHRECFKALEDHMLKVLKTHGSARGWTDGQREHNIWGKKGLALIQRAFRCRCHTGQVTLEEGEIDITERKEKKKAKPGKDLPKLNYGSRGAAAEVVERREKKSRDARNSRNGPPTPIFTVTSESFADLPEPDHHVPEQDSLVTAPPPPVLTRSYAVAAKNEERTRTTTNRYSDSGVSMGSFASLSSEDKTALNLTVDSVLSPSPTEKLSLNESLDDSHPRLRETEIGSFEPMLDTRHGALFGEVLSSASHSLTQLQEKTLPKPIAEPQMIPLEEIPSWDPLTGRTLDFLGLLASLSMSPSRSSQF
ncbi:unnamed protein product [Caenorhabditis auriculariae]|uniref:Headcase N-terminal domain-containing protein n=1 Tax=Caenorhabditis auriculariae TaxID=2777116 RepID=A0A8S1HJF1_9PELO|nr:unnamed protein product [Caenorhabditis auriculariae]